MGANRLSAETIAKIKELRASLVPIDEVASQLKVSRYSVYVHSNGGPKAYRNAWAVEKGYKDMNDYLKSKLKKRGITPRAYRRSLLLGRGFENETAYLEDYAKRRGFSSYQKYKEDVAKRKGFDSYFELKRAQDSRRLGADEEYKTKISELNLLIEQSGRSQGWVARSLGISQSTLSTGLSLKAGLSEEKISLIKHFLTKDIEKSKNKPEDDLLELKISCLLEGPAVLREIRENYIIELKQRFAEILFRYKSTWGNPTTFLEEENIENIFKKLLKNKYGELDLEILIYGSILGFRREESTLLKELTGDATKELPSKGIPGHLLEDYQALFDENPFMILAFIFRTDQELYRLSAIKALEYKQRKKERLINLKDEAEEVLEDRLEEE